MSPEQEGWPPSDGEAVEVPGPPAGTAREDAAGRGTRALVGALVAFYVLLPLDLGFPPLSLSGRPLNSAIAASLVVFLVLVLQSRLAILKYLREPYSVLQLAYCAMSVVSAFRSASPPSALHYSLLYCCTFVVNYVALRHVTRRYGTRWLSSCVAVVGVAAAAVGIAQGLFGVRLPMYEVWPDARVAGTLDNPILYAVLMALVVPYAIDLQHGGARVLAVLAVLLAGGLSGSRTVLVVAVFAIGSVSVYRGRALRAVPAACLAALLVVASLGGGTASEENSRISLLLERAGLKATSDTTASAAALGISLRREALAEGFREILEWKGLTWIVGEGYFTSASIGQRFFSWYSAVDNVYLSVLFERGLAGLVLLVGAFVTFLVRTKRAATTTLHWYAPLALALAGFSFSWDAYSTFNILVVGSMAIAMSHEEQGRARSASLRWHEPYTGAQLR